MKMKNKKIVLTVLGILIVLLSVIGITYAFFSAKIKENNKTETVIKTNELNIVFTGTQEINCSNIIPGDSCIKKFTVENISSVPVEYNIYMENITNEFNEDLVYTLEDENGSVVGEASLPVTNIDKSYLKDKINIEANTKKAYTLTIIFKNTDKPQNDYQGKSFKGTLGIDSNKVELKPEVNAVSFANDDWDTIQKAVKSGTYPYQVGDTKTITLAAHTNDCATFSTYIYNNFEVMSCNSKEEPEKQIKLRVANTSECTTENSETACGFVVEFAEISENYNFNNGEKVLSAHYGTNIGGWPASKMRRYLNDTIYKALPIDLQNAILDTKVISGHAKDDGNTNFESIDKLYLLSAKEVANNYYMISDNDTALNETRQLDYYQKLGVGEGTNSLVGIGKTYNGENADWWLRTAVNYDASFIKGFYFFDDSLNSLYYGDAAVPRGISPAFRIG